MWDWLILNVCWFKNRIDFLGCVYKVLVNVVNMLFYFICVKDVMKLKLREVFYDVIVLFLFFV